MLRVEDQSVIEFLLRAIPLAEIQAEHFRETQSSILLIEQIRRNR